MILYSKYIICNYDLLNIMGFIFFFAKKGDSDSGVADDNFIYGRFICKQGKCICHG